MQSNVLIVGLGNMGSALARGLIAAKFDVRGIICLLVDCTKWVRRIGGSVFE